MGYLTLSFAEGDDEVVEVDAYPRLVVKTGEQVEFNENHLVSVKYTADLPPVKYKAEKEKK